MDLPTTTMAPIVEVIGGVKVTFPLLRIPDFGEIATDIKADNLIACEKQLDEAERITLRKNLAADRLTAAQRYRARMEIETEEFSTYKVIDRIKTLPGAHCVLKISLRKAFANVTMTDDERATLDERIAATLDLLDLVETTNLALRVARVIKPQLPKADDKDANAGGIAEKHSRPLDLPPGQQSDAGSPT